MDRIEKKKMEKALRPANCSTTTTVGHENAPLNPFAKYTNHELPQIKLLDRSKVAHSRKGSAMLDRFLRCQPQAAAGQPTSSGTSTGGQERHLKIRDSDSMWGSRCGSQYKVPRRTVQVSLAALQARKKEREGEQHANIASSQFWDAKGMDDVSHFASGEAEKRKFEYEESALRNGVTAKVSNGPEASGWRTGKFRPPRTVLPGTKKEICVGSQMQSNPITFMKINDAIKTAKKEGERDIDALMLDGGNDNGQEGTKETSHCQRDMTITSEKHEDIEEINLLDDSEDDADFVPLNLNTKKAKMEWTEDDGNQWCQHNGLMASLEGCPKEHQKPDTGVPKCSSKSYRGTGVAIFDVFSDEEDADDAYFDNEEVFDEEDDKDDEGGTDRHETCEEFNTHEARDTARIDISAMDSGIPSNAKIILDGEEHPWWHRLPHFVPISAFVRSINPKDGTFVHIDYLNQFKGKTNAPTTRKRKSSVVKKPAGTAQRQGYWVTDNGEKAFVTETGTKMSGKAAYVAYLKSTKSKKKRTKPSSKRSLSSKKKA